MSIRKTLMLALMALAVSAFAVPAVASAAVDGQLYDVDNGATVKSGETVELTGEAEFTAFGSGIRCTVHSTLTASGASTGNVTSFVITAPSCVSKGIYEGCSVVNPESFTPWPVTVTPTDLDISGVEIFSELAGAECLFTFSALEFAEITATPLNSSGNPAEATEGIHAVSLSGEGENCNDFGCLGVEAHGTLSVVGEDTGTYALKH